MSEILLNRQDQGRTIMVALGARILVRLEESPTTGFVWTPLHAAEALALVGSDFTPPAPAALGGTGQRTLQFELRQPGSHPLLLALMRPWEAAATAVDRFTLTVQAAPGA
jgi:predicted secreted protein